MNRNIGTADRAIRIVVGVCLLALLFVLDGNARWFGLIGVVPLFTALVRWCPLYTLIGTRTCSVDGTSPAAR